MDDVRIHTPISQRTTELLAQTIAHVVHGAAQSGEVTAVLRRVCEESRNQPPELLLRRIRELWEKLANSSRMHFDERDPRYFALVGECIVIYFALPSVPVRHPPLRDVVRPRDTSGCGEPEGIPLR